MIHPYWYDIFHIWLFLSAALVINPGYMLGLMTCPAVNRQDTLNLFYAEKGWIKQNYKSPVFIEPAWLWTISCQYIFGLRHWNYGLINHWVILFKYPNLAEISLWYWMNKVFIPDYIILNSQHGWIFIIKIFKVAIAQCLLFYQRIWFILQWKE